MNTAIWVVQILLALVFALTGLMKLTQPRERLAQRMSWVNDFPPASVRLIGAVELLGGVGLVLPALTGILPWLPPLAGVGLVVVMIGATVTHARRGEYPQSLAPVILLLLALFVAYGHFVAVSL